MLVLGVMRALLQETVPAPAIGTVGWVIILAFIVLIIASFWRIFDKAGRPGWAAIVPIYNAIVLLQVSGKPWWWIILMLIPFVNIIIIILVYLGLARNFGKGTGFAIGLMLLGIIFFPILAFGDAQYQPATPGAPRM